MQTLDIPWIHGLSERSQMKMLFQFLTRTTRKAIVGMGKRQELLKRAYSKEQRRTIGNSVLATISSG